MKKQDSEDKMGRKNDKMIKIYKILYTLNSKSHSSEAFTFVRNNSVTINSKWSTEMNSHENRQTSCWFAKGQTECC